MRQIVVCRSRSTSSSPGAGVRRWAAPEGGPPGTAELVRGGRCPGVAAARPTRAFLRKKRLHLLPGTGKGHAPLLAV